MSRKQNAAYGVWTWPGCPSSRTISHHWPRILRFSSSQLTRRKRIHTRFFVLTSCPGGFSVNTRTTIKRGGRLMAEAHLG